ncbi:tRNA-specific adenosine deaminase [Trichoderma reesei QM6a]|uniref:tRNA-specific adenosine deaminase n=1 Tax=Hypocrea jecorina (strain QM6a) TaxID=431241 RepID=G0RAK9_HYPJQ|nr:tRNA-specific adenosine deaminase [Trichoderma reesei QM6a]EGR51617.1 tRNA-specific adenosine deaminase [Trichoderma reesei QM6a]
MTSRANLIARTVISQFDKLPSKRKPCVRDNGLNEWVPLSGIVAESNGVLTCLALATGMKCLPASKLTEAKGVAIHDWHAEILAIRTFNRFLLDECQTLVESLNNEHESILQRHDSKDDVDPTSRRCTRPFKVKEDVKLHMYCSEAPCGDASMELIMAAQADASPWQLPTPPKPVSASTSTSLEADSTAQLPGRAYFSQLGIVRRKPARGDAPPTLSKSCSDKIALRQCTSLLSSLASLFVDPANAYIDTLVLPESQYSAAACERAFSPTGRMKAVADRQWPGGYAFRPFKVEATDVEFAFSKRAVQAHSEAISASNLAATWSASGFEESILGGVLQGRKQFAVRGASKSSRRQMWMKSKQLSEGLSAAAPTPGSDKYLSSASSYQDIKDGRLLTDRRHVKAQARELALKGWIQNEGDADFGIA